MIGPSMATRKPSDRSARPRRFRPWLELLEQRTCLALTVPALSSLPGANHTIYLDFDGHTTMSTLWNTPTRPLINSPAYSSDADKLNFSTSELRVIENAWRRVAEDFAPFNVNVTTVPPASGDLVRSGSTDTRWGVRVVITVDTAFNCGCGGIAYIDSFNWNSDTPVFVFNTGEIGVAEAISHEVGHALGLSHDGTATSSYYGGHGTGNTSWAPIMGVGYSASVTQWDNGTYFGSNNGGANANYNKGPDDLAVITTYNGFGYRSDEAGDTLATATPLTMSGTTLSGSGRITQDDDVDLFQFTSGQGTVSLTISPAALGANLDLRADLLDGNGEVIATSDSLTSLGASLSATVAEGTYYVRIDGVGVGNPTAASPTGYSDYGSLGAYTISGTVATGPVDSLAIEATSATKNEGNSGLTPFTFTIQRSGPTSTTTSVTYRVTGVGTTPASSSDFQNKLLPTGSVTFQPGETSKLITINVLGDTTTEQNETFAVTLSQPTGATIISQASATGSILNDDVKPEPPKFHVAATSAIRDEGTGTTATPFTFTITRTGDASKTASVWYSVTGVGTAPASFQDFSGGMPALVNVRFAAGQTNATITLRIVADNVREPNEQFRVTLKLPSGATLGTATADGTILNDDGLGAGGLWATLLPDWLTRLASNPAPLGTAVIAVADPLWYFAPLSPDQLGVDMMREARETVTWVAEDPRAVHDALPPNLHDAAIDHDHDHDHDHLVQDALLDSSHSHYRAGETTHAHHGWERSFDEVFHMLHGGRESMVTFESLTALEGMLASGVDSAGVEVTNERAPVSSLDKLPRRSKVEISTERDGFICVEKDDRDTHPRHDRQQLDRAIREARTRAKSELAASHNSRVATRMK